MHYCAFDALDQVFHTNIITHWQQNRYVRFTIYIDSFILKQWVNWNKQLYASIERYLTWSRKKTHEVILSREILESLHSLVLFKIL